MKANKFKFPIVQPYIPKSGRYIELLNQALERNWLTNNGPILKQFEIELAEYLGVENLLLVANGTLALQVAYKSLDISGNVLTTPFSFAATASSLCWQDISPVFTDISRETLNLCPRQLSNFEPNTNYSAVLGVHVFGNPCDTEHIDNFAQQHDLKVVYDAAHAFATKKGNCSILTEGDASTISLHATKLFHSVEGGAIVFKNTSTLEKAKKLVNFGFDRSNNPVDVGINAKMSEVHAAMGLSLLSEVEYIVNKRAELAYLYESKLSGVVILQNWAECSENTGAYQPIILESEAQLLFVTRFLEEKGIQTRRYFYPSLSQVPAYGMNGDTPIANSISSRILCLPMYTELTTDNVITITEQLKQALQAYNR